MRLTSREDHLLRSEPADGLTSDGSELSGNAGLKRANRTEVGKLQGGGRAERHVSDDYRKAAHWKPTDIASRQGGSTCCATRVSALSVSLRNPGSRGELHVKIWGWGKEMGSQTQLFMAS